ncbi:hypothetical protein INT44_002233 [Umbelopsis vinacea]|uniref:C2H2-type domain-containing protein n=1 Tax=Umbelopsis vinacea TaxID=44442 RepID=A0A8H7Q3G8_9FUNG|nr:hypothetical protein INT44_002233 [Umbelopsis vinacea]
MFNTLQQQYSAVAKMTEDTFDQAFLDPVLFGDDHPQDALSFSHGKNSCDSSPTTSFESEWETHVLSRKSLARLEHTAQSPVMHKHSYIPPSQRNILNSPLDLDMSLCETPASLWETPIDSPLTMYSGTPYIPPTPFYTPMISGQEEPIMAKSPFIADEGYYTSQMSPFVAGFDGNPLTLINEKAAQIAQEQSQQIVYVGEQTTDTINNNSMFVPLDDCMADNEDHQKSSQRSLFDVVDDYFSSSQNLDPSSADDQDNDDEYVPSQSSKRKKSSSTRDATGRPLKRFQCQRKGCGMMFSRRFNLQTHMRVHDPNRLKLFCCDVEGCGKNFDRRHDLTRHEATVHRGERAYHCDYCEKPFSRKDALVRHLTVKGCPSQMGAM